MAPRKEAEGERKLPPEIKADQAAREFARLLSLHMDKGTRPTGSARRWSANGLGDACGVSDRAVRNWRNGTNLPDIEIIERVLFGANPDHDAARRELRTAWAEARQRPTIEPTHSPADDVAVILPPSRCFGRDDEASALIAALTAPGTANLLVLGAAGIGKTTLTRRVATEPSAIARFGRNCFFVPLETATDAAAMRAAIIQSIGLSPATTSFPAALAVMSGQPSSLVLDNLETPWEPDQSAAQDVLLTLAGTANVSLLVSLRGTAAPSSPRWSLRPTRLGELTDDDSRRLFLELAPEAGNDPAHLAYFLTALGGVPLALELVASRAAGDTPLAELWAEWERRGIALAEHPDREAGRLTSLTRSLDLSWGSRRLREPGRRLLRLLGALPAGMADVDRITLMGTVATEAARQAGVVGLAIQQGGRIDLLPPVRAYVRTAQPPGDEELASWCRHYLALAHGTGSRILGAEGAPALRRLAPEVPNIEAALSATAPPFLRREAVAALDGVCRLLSATGAGSLAPLIALRETCRTAGEPEAEADCCLWFGHIALARSDHDAARAAYEQALPLYRQVGDVLGEANCIQSLGNIALARSDHDAARAAYEQALPLHRQVDDVLGEANCIRSLGDIALRRSDQDAARAAYERALPLYRQVGAVLGEANCIRSLGDIALRRSDHDAARAASEQALPLYRQVGAVLGEANCIRSLGDMALVRSDHDAARAAYEQALPLHRQVGDVTGEGICQAMLGRLAKALGDANAARISFLEALALFQRVHSIQNCAVVLEDLAGVTTGAEREEYLKGPRGLGLDWVAG